MPPPPGTLPGDRIVVGFVNDHALTVATTLSPGWIVLGEEHQGDTTNQSLTIFTKATAAGVDDDLVVDVDDTSGSGPASATWTAVALVGSGGGPIGGTAGMADGGNAATATFLPVQGLAAGDYDSIAFLALDNNGSPGHVVDDPPSGGWGNEITPGSNTPDTIAYSWDRSVIGFSGDLAPGAVTWPAPTEQWVTGHVVFPSGTGITAEGHRFYFGNQANDWGAAPAALGFWENDAAAADPQLLAGEPTGTKTSSGVPETSAVDTAYTMVRQWVSLPAAAAGTVFGSINFVLGIVESAAAADFTFALGVWVTEGDTATRRGQVIGADGLGVGGTVEWPTTATAVGFFADAGSSPTLAADVAFQEGDRIVIEIGYVPGNAPDTTAYTGTIHYGGTGSTDLAIGDTTAIDTRPAWVDLLVSPGVTFEDGGVVVDGTASADLGFTATATGTVVVDGTASADLGFTAAATGRRVVNGTASADLGFTAEVEGRRVAQGTAEADLGFVAHADGIVLGPSSGIAHADLGFVAHAEGLRIAKGTAAADLGFTAHAAGRRIVHGTAHADLGFAAHAEGEPFQDATEGQAHADLGFTAHATGTVIPALGKPFLPELGPSARFAVEIAWGADPAGNPDDWTWTDITGDVYADPGISTKCGRDDEAGTSQPASCSMVLRNDDHAYSLGGHSPNWPHVRRNVPVRVRINPGDGDLYLVFIGNADGFTPGWITTGGIPTVTLSASGTMRRILQGDAPVTSAYRRAMTELGSVVAYWPFEEGHNATFAPAVRGGSAMVTATDSHEFDADSPFDCSAPLVRLRSSAAGTFEDFGATVDQYLVTGETQVRFLMSIPRNGLPNGAFLCDIFTTGSAARFSLTYWDGLIGGVEDPDGNGTLDGLHFTIWNDENLPIHEELNVGFPVLGASLRFSVELEEQGADIVWRVATLAPGSDNANFIEHTLEGETVGRVTSIFMGGNDVDDVTLGHVTLQNQVTDFFAQFDPLAAYTGEFNTAATGRMIRLGRENGVRVRVFGTGSVSLNETLGPQLVRPLMELLRECEAADQGQLYDGIFEAGLIYSTRRYRELGAFSLTIDAAEAELAGPFEPTDDDQRNRNRVEATITTGVSATFEDVRGPLGTDTIGIYDSSLEVNNEHDDMAIHYAAWLVHTGTVEGYRVGSITLDLRAVPHLAAAVLNLVPGDRIDVTHVDQVFAGWLPGDIPLSLIIEGISHEVGPRHWRATFACSPFSPWGVAQAAAETGDDNPFAWRLDTDGTRLVGDRPAGATSLVVSNEPVLVAEDTFTRTVSNGWGTADLGGVYAVAGTPGAQVSDFNVAASVATIAVQAVNRQQSAYLADIDESDVDVAITCTCSATDIVGGQIELAEIIVRGRASDDYTYARVVVRADQTVFLSVVEVDAGVQTELVQPVQVPGLTFTGTVRCRMQAEGHTLRVRVWDPAGAEPTVWHREVIVTASRSGFVGTRVAVAANNTNTLPLVFSHDAFSASTVDPPGGPAWTTDPDDYPLTLSVGGIPVRATACTTGVVVDGPTIVVMVGDPAALTPGDAAIVDRLADVLGHRIELVDDAAPEFPGNYDGVLITESVVDTLAATKYAAAAKPLIIMEPAIWDDHELSAATIATAAQTAWNVQAVAELDAGLSGAVTVYGSAQEQRHANISLLGGGAQVVAQLAGDATRATHFVYETGAALRTGTAPARRVALGIPDAAVTLLTDDGWALFDAAAGWAYGPTTIDNTLQRFTVDELPLPRTDGMPIALWDPRPIGL